MTAATVFSAAVPRSRLGIDELATPLGINESLAFRAFDKTIIFGHWLSKTQKLALAYGAFHLKKAFTILLELFSKEQKKSFSKNHFPKRRL